MIENRDFWAFLAFEIDQGSSLRESLKDTWLVETVETDIKAAVESNILLTPACCWRRFGSLKKVRPGYVFEDFSGSLCWILISSGQNVIKLCILVPVKPHGPKNSVGWDLAETGSDPFNRNWKIIKMTETVDFWSRLALENDQGSSLRESLRSTWLVKTEIAFSVRKAILYWIYRWGKLTSKR